MSRYFVTGGSGFLGRHLIAAITARGDDVCALRRRDRQKSITDDDLANVEWVDGNLLDPDHLAQLMKDCDAVFHLAGVIGYRRSDRQLMEKVNIFGTESVLAAAIKAQIPKFIHMSSVVTCGASFSSQEIRNEESAFNLSQYHLGYFDTKLAAESRALDYHREHKLAVYIVNPSTIYGPHDFEKSSRSAQRQAVAGKLKVYTPGGVNVVDVDAVVNSTLAVMERGRPGEKYILGGENLTIYQLLSMLAEFAGHSRPYIRIPATLLQTLGLIGDAVQLCGGRFFMDSERALVTRLFHWFDSTKAITELGHKPLPASTTLQNSVRAWLAAQAMSRGEK